MKKEIGTDSVKHIKQLYQTNCTLHYGSMCNVLLNTSDIPACKKKRHHNKLKSVKNKRLEARVRITS
jgi:hypothetical protein